MRWKTQRSASAIERNGVLTEQHTAQRGQVLATLALTTSTIVDNHMELVNRDFNAALNVRKMCSAERETCVADAIQRHRARAPARRVQGETKTMAGGRSRKGWCGVPVEGYQFILHGRRTFSVIVTVYSCKWITELAYMFLPCDFFEVSDVQSRYSKCSDAGFRTHRRSLDSHASFESYSFDALPLELFMEWSSA